MHRIDRPCVDCGDVQPVIRFDLAWTRRAAAAALALTLGGAVWRLAPYAGQQLLKDKGAPPSLMGETAAQPPIVRPAGDLPLPALSPTSAPGPTPAAMAAPVASATSPLGQSPPVSAPQGSESIVWIPAVARTWVNVRSDASRGGEVVGVIKPSTRAMLGTDRAGWRQVRSPDAVGWVDPRLFEADSVRTRGE